MNPTVTLGRDVTNADGTTVQLRDAAGHTVAATITYDAMARRISIVPAAALPNGRYSIHLGGLTDTGGDTLPDAGTTFSVGPAPDEIALQTTLQLPPSGFRTSATATLSFSANEAGSGFWCSYDNQAYHACTSPQHVTATVGTHSFRVFARDLAGNEDPTPALATWTYRPAVHGYWMLGGTGAIYQFGNAPGLGNTSTAHRPTSTPPSRVTATGSSTRSAGCSPSATPGRTATRRRRRRAIP